MAKALVVIPTYNEKDNIVNIVNDILKQSEILDILIVDDNSPDGTGAIADDLAKKNNRIFVIHRSGKLGLGTAYVAGFKYAIEKKYDYIFEMDADFSHDPNYIPAFLEKIKEYDLVIGSRYLTGVNVVNWPLKRLMLSYFANIYAKIITGLNVSDCTGGFKCFRREVLESIDLNNIKSNGYSFQIEMNFLAANKGFRVCEIPIIFYERAEGKSKMSKKIVFEAIWMVWHLRLRKLFGKI